jgi:hypothetical protein
MAYARIVGWRIARPRCDVGCRYDAEKYLSVRGIGLAEGLGDGGLLEDLLVGERIVDV